MTGSSPSFELQKLLNEAVDGELTDADEAALQWLLRDDPSARCHYVRFMQLHAELHWDHGASAALLVSPDHRNMDAGQSIREPKKRLVGWTVLVVAIGAVAAGLLLAVSNFERRDAGEAVMRPKARAIATVEMIQGTVSFRSADFDSRITPESGRSLPTGTLLVEGESSSAQFRFRGGTLITLSGNAEVSLRDDGQKLLNLRYGMLTAEVRQQPSGTPLVIETPTARIEVLGTTFTLAAEPEQTLINVAEGRVRLRRLVDGQTVDIQQEHSCVASLDARDELRADTPSRSTLGWQHRFGQPPPSRWKGQWLPAEGDLPARVRAVPCMMGRKHSTDDTPIVHYGVTARKLDGVSLGSLPNDPVLKMRFRTEQPASLQIMLGINLADGRFGGNFEIKLPPDAGTSRIDGSRELIVPLSDFRSLIDRYPSMAGNARPYLILITTYTDDAGLEVFELAIVNAEESHE